MKVLLFVLLVPVVVFGAFREEIIEDFSVNLSNLDIFAAHQSLNYWENSYLEDKEAIDSCRAFLFLIENKLDEGRDLFESSFF